MRPPGAMCLPHTNNMDSKIQGAGPGGGASLRPRAGGVPLEPFIHQVGTTQTKTETSEVYEESQYPVRVSVSVDI